MEQKINEIEINGIQYVVKDSIVTQEYSGDYCIVILQRGWVYVGILEKNENDCILHNAYVIRRWGTTKGLGELCNGPLENTILDKCNGEVKFHWMTAINATSINKELWKNILL